MYFVRTAGEQDLKKVRDLLVEAWHATYDELAGVARVNDRVATMLTPIALKTRLGKPGSEFLVADNGSEIGGVGYAIMSETMTKTVVLQLLYVRPDLQRQGIGRDLFAELETCFPEAEIMRLEVEIGNVSAIAFYEAHGFQEVGRNEHAGAGQSGLPAFILEKPLLPHRG